MSPNYPYISRKRATKFAQGIKEALEKPDRHSLLHYANGIGGIGKTTLLGKIAESYANDCQCIKVSCDKADNDNIYIDSPIKLMEVIDQELSSNIFLGLSPFQTIFKKYQKTLSDLEKSPIEGEKQVTPEQIAEVKKLARVGAKDIGLIAAAQTDGGVASPSVISPIAERAADFSVDTIAMGLKAYDLLKKHNATKDKPELQELVENPIPQFAKAIIQTLIKKSQAKPILLFIDTYEKATPDFDTFLCRFLLSDEKLREAPFRIIMAGRYSLNNKKYDRIFQRQENVISEIRLGKFDKSGTEKYLKEIGITESKQVDKIWKATKGYPYYLNLIRRQKKSGKEIKLFRGGQDMVELLLDDLSDIERKVVCLAAYCRWFDRSVIEYLIEQNNIEQNPEQGNSWFNWLVNRNFTINEESHRFDDVARNVIRQAEHNNDRRSFYEIHQQLFQYFQQLANETVATDELVSEKYEDPEWCEYAIESIYHALYADKKQGQIILLTHFFEGAYLKFPDVAEKSFAIVISETDVDDFEILPGNTKQFLQSISWAIVFGWQFVGQNPSSYNIEVNSNENFIDPNISEFIKYQIELSISRCLHKEDTLLGLSRCFALLCKYVRNQSNNLREIILKQSELEIEKVGIRKYQELSIFIWMRLAFVLFDQKKYIQALEKFDKVIDLDECSFLAWKNKAITFGEMDKCNEALDCFNKALELDPNNYSTWAERGIISGRMGQDRQALNDFNVSLQISPNHSWVWRNRALALLNLKNPHWALVDCNKAIEINLKDSKAHRNRGVILYAMNKHSEAIKSFNKALELDPCDSLSWNDRGMILWRTQKYNDALDNYNKAIIVTPSSSIFLNMKALILSLQGKYNEALNNIDQAIELDPQEILYTANKSIILSRMSNFEEAIHYCETAISSNPEDESGHYATACYFALQNKVKEALKHLEKSIDIAPLKCKLEAKLNPDFNCLRDNPKFKALIDN